MKEILLEAKGLIKTFPGVRALDNVDFRLERGSVHAVVGENGAGKSTLIKIISGIYQPDKGELYLDGEHIALDSPRDAHAKGILTIHQELSLVPHLSVAENVFLGIKKPTRYGGLIDWKELYRRTEKVMHELGLDIDPRASVDSLKIGTQQLVEIAKGFAVEPRILILDEPTSALSIHETELLFKTIRGIRDKGFSVIYISHRMEEIFDITDVATILRDGSKIATSSMADLTPETITRMMTGKDTALVDRATYRQGARIGAEVLRTENLEGDGVNGVSFALHQGEILGFAGLMGSGRSEIAHAIFGTPPKTGGKVFVSGNEVVVLGPKDALKHGIGYTTEDRKSKGLLPNQSVKTNLTISILAHLARLGWLGREETATAQKIVSSYNVITPNLQQQIKYLSGGNQQKVVIARTLAAELKVIILDEPTKGVDVGAKQEVFKLIRRLSEAGLAIIFISSELSEVFDVADRILIIESGKVKNSLDRSEVTKEKVLQNLLLEKHDEKLDK